jgi:hypothetical protein
MDRIDSSEETILRVINVKTAQIIRTKKLDHIKDIGGINHPFMAMDNMHIYIVSASTLYVHMRSTLSLIGSFNLGIDQSPRCHLISPGEIMCAARNEVYTLRFNKPVSCQVLTGVLADPCMGHEVEHQFDQSNWVKMAASILQIPLIGVATTTLLLAKHPDVRFVGTLTVKLCRFFVAVLTTRLVTESCLSILNGISLIQSFIAPSGPRVQQFNLGKRFSQLCTPPLILAIPIFRTHWLNSITNSKA